MSDPQWFVEVKSADDNVNLRTYFAQDSTGDENMLRGVMGTDGRPHDVFQVPNSAVGRLRDQKLAKNGIDPIFRFRFWKRDNPNQKIRPADFLEKRHVSNQVKEVPAKVSSRKAGE